MTAQTVYWREQECSIEGCTEHLHQRKLRLCNKHYIAFYKYGDPLANFKSNTKICDVDNCGELTAAKTKRYCRKHGRNFDYTGDPLKPGTSYRLTQEERFAFYTRELDGCLIWTGPTYKHFAGCEKYYEYPRWDTTEYTTRKVWEWANGEIPDGMVISHIPNCLSSLCVRLQHLVLTDVPQLMQRPRQSNLDSLTGFRGVTYNGRYNRWQAYAKGDGKIKYAGWFTDLVEAANAARELRQRYYGTQEPEVTLADRTITRHNIRKLLPSDWVQQQERTRSSS